VTINGELLTTADYYFMVIENGNHRIYKFEILLHRNENLRGKLILNNKIKLN
jgi:hypothetical protein